MYDLAKAYRSIVEDWEASNGHTKDTIRLLYGPWHDHVGEHIYAQSFRMWNTLRFHPFLQVSQIFQRRKIEANKLNLTSQAQSIPITMGILTKVLCTSGPNLVVLAWTGDEFLCGQAQNFDFEVKFDLEGQGQSLCKTIEIFIKVFYTCDPNLVILARTVLELSRGQASDWHTHGQTDVGNDNTRWPNWPQVKMCNN